MARSDSSPLSSSNALDEDDYIDIEVSSSSSTPTFYCSYSNITPPNPREFEFQMFSSKSLDNKANTTTTSPADELFYKGKLLPLHLPPRLQMVEKLLQNSKSYREDQSSLISSLATTQNTPLTSCNISPTESCQVSGELNPNEYFFGEFSNLSSTEVIKMKSWMKKLKKYSSLGLKFKAYSRAYLKALFTKSGCSDEASSCNVQTKAKIIGNETVSKAKECLNKCVKAGKRNNPFGLIQKQRIVAKGDGNDQKDKMIEDNSSHRRSFSGATKRCTLTTTATSNTTSTSSGSSNSSSFSSNNGYYEVHLLKRSNSANSEIESSIQGAIAHCKQSHHQQQQQMYKSSARKTVSEVGLCSLTVSRIAAACADDQERPQLWRG